MSLPVKARVEAKSVNDELARRPKGKSLAVDCALDEVSIICAAFAKALTGDARHLSEHLASRHVIALSQWPKQPRLYKLRCDASSALPFLFVTPEYEVICFVPTAREYCEP